MSTPVRVRFAPSPTGFHHLGNIRSALFNYLLAKHTDGTFILRLEDTDRERLVSGADQYLTDTLDWLGLSPDEGFGVGGDYGPYIQSERLDLYRQYADELVTKKALYPCWCTPERLDGLRKDAQKNGVAFKYDRYCLSHPQSLDLPHVLRFFIPERPEVISWHDGVKGHVEFETKELDDFVALKSDGYPTYNFAVVVDDHLMAITHVLRADEFVPTTPKNLLVYEAFGWVPPEFVHLPPVLGPDKAKLSKRHGATPALDYRDNGYLPEAVINFLSALGWNDGTTQEIYTKDELIAAFSVDRVQKSPAVFDAERLTWLNGLYIRQLPLEELAARCDGFWPQAAQQYDEAYRQSALSLVQERLKYLGELPELTDFFFSEPTVDPGLLHKAYEPQEARRRLSELVALLETTDWTREALEAALRAYVEREELKTGQLFGLVRVAMTGKTAAPGLFETMDVLGKEATLRRLHASREV